MIGLVKELKDVIQEKRISPETAARLIGCTGRQVRRWIGEEAIPNLMSRQAIRRGIRRIKRTL